MDASNPTSYRIKGLINDFYTYCLYYRYKQISITQCYREEVLFLAPQPRWDSNPERLLQRENGFRDRRVNRYTTGQ